MLRAISSCPVSFGSKVMMSRSTAQGLSDYFDGTGKYTGTGKINRESMRKQFFDQLSQIENDGKDDIVKISPEYSVMTDNSVDGLFERHYGTSGSPFFVPSIVLQVGRKNNFTFSERRFNLAEVDYTKPAIPNEELDVQLIDKYNEIEDELDAMKPEVVRPDPFFNLIFKERKNRNLGDFEKYIKC